VSPKLPELQVKSFDLRGLKFSRTKLQYTQIHHKLVLITKHSEERYEKTYRRVYRAGVRFTNFRKATTLPTASTAPVFTKLSPQISARHKCFLFNLSTFTIHQIFPNPLQNEYCCWVIFTLSVCPFVPCFIPRSRKPTIRFSVLKLINKNGRLFSNCYYSQFFSYNCGDQIVDRGIFLFSYLYLLTTQ
jgi:hypothetical protein